MMASLWASIRKQENDIHDLVSSSDMWKSNNLMVKGLSYGVTINLYVLLVFLVDKIDSNLDGISVVSM
jgi:hypothetical protein